MTQLLAEIFLMASLTTALGFGTGYGAGLLRVRSQRKKYAEQDHADETGVYLENPIEFTRAENHSIPDPAPPSQIRRKRLR